jgi:predicted Zn-ribbon and HTH transcriptional regulator
MSLPFIDRIRRRDAEKRAAAPQCVRCGRAFVASGLDESSRCWWCAKLISRPVVNDEEQQ